MEHCPGLGNYVTNQYLLPIPNQELGNQQLTT